MIRKEAESVCLHDGNRVTLRRRVSWVRVPAALFVVNVGKEDACGALAGHIRKVNIEGKSATQVSVVEEGPFGVVLPHFVHDEGAVVMAHPKAFVLSLEIASVKTLHVELIPVAVSSLAAPFFNVADERLPLSHIICVVIMVIIVLAVNHDIESPECPCGVFTADRRGCVLAFEVRATIHVIPVRKDDCHSALEIVIQRFKVVHALSFHNDFVSFRLPLHDRSSDLPHVGVVVHRNEVSLDGEPLIGVDYGAIGSPGIFSVLLSALLSHLVIAHGGSFTFSVFARVGRQLEAVVVRLHDLDGWARVLWLVILGIFNVTILVRCDKIDTSDTSTFHTAHFHPVVDGATSDVRLVGRA